MTTVVIGELISESGINVSTRFDATGNIFSPFKRSVWATPAGEVRSVQPAVIPLRLDDHRRLPDGRIFHLEIRPLDGGLWAVGELDVDIRPEGDLFLSAEVVATHDVGSGIGRDVEIRGAAIVARSAMAGLPPITLVVDDLDQHGRRLDGWNAELLERARAARSRRLPGEPIIVEGQNTYSDTPTLDLASRSTAGGLELRSSQVATVSAAGRRIELVVMPYEKPALVAHEGRVVTEICTRGAWRDIQRQTNRIRVNRDHDESRTCGRAVRFDPDNDAGLIAEVRIAATPLGDETLALAEEDCLDVSAGFRVEPGGARWETRDRRRLNKLWLGHIAMVADPAYQSARVLAVRAGAKSNTPRLDEARAMLAGIR